MQLGCKKRENGRHELGRWEGTPRKGWLDEGTGEKREDQASGWGLQGEKGKWPFHKGKNFFSFLDKCILPSLPV